MITWRHFGKTEIVAVINNPILRASLQIRQLLTGRTAQGERRTIALRHPPRARPMWSTIRKRLEGRWRETVTWYQPPRDTKTAGAVLGVGHQRQMTPHSPPPAESDNNSQLSITLTFLRISLSLKLTEPTSRFVTIGRKNNNILSTDVSINQTGPKLVSKN